MVYVHTYSQSDNAWLRYDHLKSSKMAAGRHLGFHRTENGAVRSAVPGNPTLEPKKGIGRRVAELWHLNFFAKCVNGPRGQSLVAGRQYFYCSYAPLL